MGDSTTTVMTLRPSAVFGHARIDTIDAVCVRWCDIFSSSDDGYVQVHNLAKSGRRTPTTICTGIRQMESQLSNMYTTCSQMIHKTQCSCGQIYCLGRACTFTCAFERRLQ